MLMADLLHILETAVNAVLPIVLLILLGYFLRQTGFLSKDFVKMGNKLVFKVFLPCMLFINVYSIESFSGIQWNIVIFCVAMLLVLFLLGLATVNLTTRIPERKGVILQNVFRSNFAIIGMSLAGALGGDGAVAICAIVSAFTIPVLNILAVVSLTVFVGGEGKKVDVKGILRNVAKNPLIIGILLGILCLLLRALQMKAFGAVKFSLSRDLKFVYTALNNLKSVASPFALVVLGGQFEFSAARDLFREIVVGVLWRVVLAPVLAITCAILLSTHTGLITCGINEYPALIALFGSPTAVSSAIMAGQMGNDEQLATQLVVWTSICSIVTIFLTVCVLMATGMLAC